MTTLLYDAQQFTIYVGYFLLIVGVIGNAINVFVFLKVRIYRKNPCIFYFLIGSIDNILYILLNLTIRILSVGYNIDVTGTSSIWCKIRQYLLVTLSIIPMALSCLATIDQFLITSKIVYLRNFSQIKWAHRIVLIVIIILCLHGIPILVFFDISPISKSCVDMNAGYSIYALVYVIGIVCMIPVFIMIIFGWLTYRNIHQTINLAELRADHQLIRMTLIHVVLAIVSLIPFGIYNVYSAITRAAMKSSDQQLKEYFIASVLSMATYLYYVGSCYTFLIASKRFRQTVKDQLFLQRARNRVAPF